MSDATGIPSVEIAPKRRSRLADFFIRLVREKPLGTISGIIILILIFVSIFADVLAPYGYTEMHLIDRLQGSSARYLLGTDQLGRDFLSRIIYGARLSLTVGLAATAVNVVVAVLIGGATTATLVDMAIPLSRIVALQVGTVLPVPIHRTVPLSIADIAIAHGAVGALDDRVALEIHHTAFAKDK